jgi:hypothetical protein
MKILLGILAVVLVAASVFADYKWRKWIAARRSERDSPVVGDSSARRDRQ